MWVNDARKFKYYRLMESNGHSVILKNVGINAGWLWLVIIGF